MNRTEVRDALYPDCPIRNILSRVGDKWSMLVLFTLETNGNLRFKELQRPRCFSRSSATRRVLVICQRQEPTSTY